MYHQDGDAVAIVASKGGQPTHPAWFHNLKANPDTTIQIGSVVRDVRARVATDEERDRLWPSFVAFYPGYDFFQRHAKDRKIPIVILVRNPGQAAIRSNYGVGGAGSAEKPRRGRERGEGCYCVAT